MFHHARRGVPLRAEGAEALAHLARMEPPLPAHLPREIAEVLAALVAAG